MSKAQAEIQAQLEAANARLMEKRRALGIRDDRPVHVSVLCLDFMIDLLEHTIREAEAGRLPTADELETWEKFVATFHPLAEEANR